MPAIKILKYINTYILSSLRKIKLMTKRIDKDIYIVNAENCDWVLTFSIIFWLKTDLQSHIPKIYKEYNKYWDNISQPSLFVSHTYFGSCSLDIWSSLIINPHKTWHFLSRAFGPEACESATILFSVANRFSHRNLFEDQWILWGSIDSSSEVNGNMTVYGKVMLRFVISSPRAFFNSFCFREKLCVKIRTLLYCCDCNFNCITYEFVLVLLSILI